MMPVRYYSRRLFFWLIPSYMRGLLARKQPGEVIASNAFSLGPRTIFHVARGGRVSIGEDFITDRDVEIQVMAGGDLHIGHKVYIGHGSVIACSGHMRIGSHTLFADMVTVRDKEHGYEKGKLIRESAGVQRDILIGANCWLCSKVTVTAGARVGNNVVVGANAVVTDVFGNNLLLGGIPARPIREIECGLADESSYDAGQMDI